MNTMKKIISLLLMMSGIGLIIAFVWSGQHYSNDNIDWSLQKIPFGWHLIYKRLESGGEYGEIEWRSIDFLLYVIPCVLSVINWYMPYERWIRQYKYKSKWR